MDNGGLVFLLEVFFVGFNNTRSNEFRWDFHCEELSWPFLKKKLDNRLKQHIKADRYQHASKYQPSLQIRFKHDYLRSMYMEHDNLWGRMSVKSEWIEKIKDRQGVLRNYESVSQVHACIKKQ